MRLKIYATYALTNARIYAQIVSDAEEYRPELVFIF